MTPASLYPNGRFSLCRISYLSLHFTRRRSSLLRSQTGTAVERCAVRRLRKGFRLPIPPSCSREWKIRNLRAVQNESTVSLDENSKGGEADNVEISIDGDVYRSTLRLVECAMFAAVTGLVYYLSNSLAIEVATAMLLLTLSGPLKACTYLVRATGALGYVLVSSFLLKENILSLLLLNCGFFVFLLHMLYAVFLSRLGMRFSLVLPGWLEKAL